MMQHPIISLIVSALIATTFTAGELSGAFVSHNRRHVSSFAATIRRNNINQRLTSYSRIVIPKLYGMNQPSDGDDDDISSNNDQMDLADLHRRVEEQRQNEQRQAELYSDGSMFSTSPSTDSSSIDIPEDVFIIVYNPDTEEQGVHTLEVPKGSGINFILAFEDEEVCRSFCASLRDQQFFDPKVKEIKLISLEEYCEDLDDVFVQTIPKGLNLKPPSERVDELDLNPDRDMEVEFVDYLYRMSSSSSSDDDIIGSMGNDGDGGALYSNDSRNGGGSWE